MQQVVDRFEFLRTALTSDKLQAPLSSSWKKALSRLLRARRDSQPESLRTTSKFPRVVVENFLGEAD